MVTPSTHACTQVLDFVSGSNSDQTGVDPSFRFLAKKIWLVLPASGVCLGPFVVTRRAGAWGSQAEKPPEWPATTEWPCSSDGRHGPFIVGWGGLHLHFPKPGWEGDPSGRGGRTGFFSLGHLIIRLVV